MTQTPSFPSPLPSPGCGLDSKPTSVTEDTADARSRRQSLLPPSNPLPVCDTSAQDVSTWDPATSSWQQHMACSAATPDSVMLQLGLGPCASPRSLRDEGSVDSRSEGLCGGSHVCEFASLISEEWCAFGIPMPPDPDEWDLNSGLLTGVPASRTGFVAPVEQSADYISSDVACQPTQPPPFPVSPRYPLGWPPLGVANYHFTQNPGTIDSTLTTSQDPTGWGVPCVPNMSSAAGIDPTWLDAGLRATQLHPSPMPFPECRGAAERDWTAGNGGPDLDSSTETSESASVMWAES